MEIEKREKLILVRITEIVKILLKQKIKLSVAESLTCGKLQSSIGEVSGVSDCFKGGITAYGIDEKVKFLYVDRVEADSVNCVSQSVANQMSKGVSIRFNSDIGIGTTGYAERYKNKEQQAYYSIYFKKGEVMLKGKVNGSDMKRKEFQLKVVDAIFEKLLNYLKTDFMK